VARFGTRVGRSVLASLGLSHAEGELGVEVLEHESDVHHGEQSDRAAVRVGLVAVTWVA
jgi:hypothetical protein